MNDCALCGTSAPNDHPPLTWGLSLENGRITRYCDPCTRDQLHSIESRLDLASR